jgi:hypothetical protein
MFSTQLHHDVLVSPVIGLTSGLIHRAFLVSHAWLVTNHAHHVSQVHPEGNTGRFQTIEGSGDDMARLPASAPHSEPRTINIFSVMGTVMYAFSTSPAFTSN